MHTVDAYRELFERSADAILILEGNRFIDCNQATVDMLRYTDRAELLKTHPSELSPPTQPDGRSSYEKADEMIATAFEKGTHRFEWVHKRADDTVFPVEVLLTAVQEPGRRVLHVVWRDITDRKLLEDRLRHTQKLEAVGKLAGGIAHDFNNLLVAILGHADLLAMELPGHQRAQDRLRHIRDSGRRASDLVRQLLAFGRKQQLTPHVLDVCELVDDLRGLLEPLVGGRVRLVVRHTDQGLRVRVDRGQLEQVLLNLASNGRDAMAGGGVLAIETSKVWVNGEALVGEEDLADGYYARVSVSDNGAGMAPQTVARAFDPFFTTKEVGKGTGLGLATVYGIVKQSGGTARITSMPGTGTTVRVFLPTTTDEVSPEPAPSSATVAGGDETILVAEDDPAVYTLVTEILQKAGYTVVNADDGLRALSTFLEIGPENVDLLLSDVIMPHLTGPELLSKLVDLGHAPRVLFMSGYTNDSLTSLGERHANIHLVEKPFSTWELLRRVRRALDAERPSFG